MSAPGPTSPSASKRNRRLLEANTELQETKRYLTRLTESSTDAIIATDKEGNVVLFSEGAETLLGYRAEEVIGRPLRSLRHLGAGPRNRCARCASAGAPWLDLTALKQRTAARISVLVSASVLYRRSRRGGGNGRLCHRLTGRKLEEEELRRAHEELEKRVDERTTELKAARERLQYLMTVTPAIVYTNQANDFTCTFVSENVARIMGFHPGRC